MEMDTTTIVIAVLAGVILLVVGGYLGVVFARRQRTKRLQDRFGSEYDRVLHEVGDQREVEDELEARIKHVKGLDLRELTDEEKERYTREWRANQAKFVDHPVVAIQEADELLTEVMEAKGYPVDDFEQRAADLSVDFPDLVTNYRGMREITTKSEREEVNTEELRQAMVHSRALFEELVGAEISEYKNQKEKI
jgi:type I site-specific restriction endonuclease